MSRLKKQSLLLELKRLKPDMVEKFKVKEIGLFGSYVRNEQDESSDIDVLVELECDADLFDLLGLAIFLEDELRSKVDVVSKNALRPELKQSVLQEVVQV